LTFDFLLGDIWQFNDSGREGTPSGEVDIEISEAESMIAVRMAGERYVHAFFFFGP
jgi:hypothetical protein